MAVRPSAVYDAIVAAIVATQPYDDSEYARRRASTDAFALWTGSADETPRDRNFVLQLRTGANTVGAIAMCELREIKLALLVSYGSGHYADAARRVADDADALEQSLLGLTNLAAIQRVVTADSNVDEDFARGIVVLEMPFSVTYLRGE